MKRPDGGLQVNDLRFGTFSGKATDADDYIFRFNWWTWGLIKLTVFSKPRRTPDDTAKA